MKSFKSYLKFLHIIFLFLGLLLIFLYIKINYKYFLCQKCLNEKIIEEKCSECEPDTLFKSIKYAPLD